MKKLVLLFSLFLAFTSQAQDEENPFEAHKAIFMDKPALDFKIIDVMTGKETALSDYKGKVTFVVGEICSGKSTVANQIRDKILTDSNLHIAHEKRYTYHFWNLQRDPRSFVIFCTLLLPTHRPLFAKWRRLSRLLADHQRFRR